MTQIQHSHSEEDLREVAWEVISRLTVGRLLEDCVEALVEAYQMDEELYITDKEMLDEEDGLDTTMPMHSYISEVIAQEQQEQDATVTE